MPTLSEETARLLVQPALLNAQTFADSCAPLLREARFPTANPHIENDYEVLREAIGSPSGGTESLEDVLADVLQESLELYVNKLASVPTTVAAVGSLTVAPPAVDHRRVRAHEAATADLLSLIARRDSAVTSRARLVKGLYGAYRFYQIAEQYGSLDDPSSAPAVTDSAAGTKTHSRRRRAATDGPQAANPRIRDDLERLKQACNFLLGDDDVKTFIYLLHGTKPNDHKTEYEGATLLLHKAGTTSFVLELKVRGREYALKLVKPWYFDDVKEQTECYESKYADRFGRVNADIPDAIPTIFQGGERFILMKFVHGQRLRELFTPVADGEKHFNLLSLDERKRDEAFEALRVIVAKLSTILKICATLDPSDEGVDLLKVSNQSESSDSQIHGPLYHGDISATNILVQRSGDDWMVHLIDFGINYLYTNSSVATEQHNAGPLAPEILSRRYDAKPTIEGDLYAIGLVLVELLSGRSDLSGNVDTRLDVIYTGHVGLGSLVDGLVDPSPAYRLLELFPDADLPKNDAIAANRETYDRLKARVSDELRLASASYAEKRGTIQYILLSFAEVMLFPGVRDLVKYVSSRGETVGRLSWLRALSPFRPERDLSDRLLVRIPLVLSFVAGALFSAKAGSLLLGVQVSAAQWRGWSAAWLSAMVGAKFYVSILGDVDRRALPGLTRFFTPFVAFVILPVFVAELVNPDLWIICAAFGFSFVVLSNFSWAMACARATRVIREEMQVSDSMAAVAGDMWMWSWLLLAYVIMMYILSFFVYNGTLGQVPGEDLWAFWVLNNLYADGKMYIFNSTSDAPRTRTGLQRIISRYRRAEARRRGAEALGGVVTVAEVVDLAPA